MNAPSKQKQKTDEASIDDDDFRIDSSTRYTSDEDDDSDMESWSESEQDVSEGDKERLWGKRFRPIHFIG